MIKLDTKPITLESAKLNKNNRFGANLKNCVNFGDLEYLNPHDLVTSELPTRNGTGLPQYKETIYGAAVDFDKTLEATANNYYTQTLAESIGTDNFFLALIFTPTNRDSDVYRYVWSTGTTGSTANVNIFLANTSDKIGFQPGSTTALTATQAGNNCVVTYGAPHIYICYRNSSVYGHVLRRLDTGELVASDTTTRGTNDHSSTGVYYGCRGDVNTQRFYDGVQYFALYGKGDFTTQEYEAFSADPWQIFEQPSRVHNFPFIPSAAAGGGYTLTADSGSYTYNGTATNLEYHRVVSAESGSYSYIGTDANLEYHKNLIADAGSYTYSGIDSNLEYHRILTAESGSYTYTGSDATLTYIQGYTLTAESGSYSYTGTDANLEYHRVLSAESGSYAYTGQDATLTYTPVGSYTLIADAGFYTYTGTDSNLEWHRVITAESGSYTYSGQDATLKKGFPLTAESGSYSITGTVANLEYHRVLSAAAGTYTYTGTAATLNYSAAPYIYAAGLEYTLYNDNIDYTLSDDKLHYTLRGE